MKATFTFAILLFFSVWSYSQNLDLVVNSQGDSIVCKIDSITDSQLYFHLVQKRGAVQYGLHLNEMQSYSYNSISEEQYAYINGTATLYNFDKTGYKHLKHKYSKRLYKYQTTDKYNPGAAGFLALIPSVGHIYTNEPLRGLAFLGGMAGSFGTMVVGFGLAWGGAGIGAPLFFVGAAGVIVFYVWNIIDAVQVTKVKNLALRNHDISFRILPNIEFDYSSALPMNNFGARLVLTF
jgi:hypothetical protein